MKQWDNRNVVGDGGRVLRGCEGGRERGKGEAGRGRRREEEKVKSMEWGEGVRVDGMEESSSMKGYVHSEGVEGGWGCSHSEERGGWLGV